MIACNMAKLELPLAIKINEVFNIALLWAVRLTYFLGLNCLT